MSRAHLCPADTGGWPPGIEQHAALPSWLASRCGTHVLEHPGLEPGQPERDPLSPACRSPPSQHHQGRVFPSLHSAHVEHHHLPGLCVSVPACRTWAATCCALMKGAPRGAGSEPGMVSSSGCCSLSGRSSILPGLAADHADPGVRRLARQPQQGGGMATTMPSRVPNSTPRAGDDGPAKLHHADLPILQKLPGWMEPHQCRR